MRNVIAFDHRISRNEVKAICERNGLDIRDLDVTGVLFLGGGRRIVVRHTRASRSFWYVDENRVEGLLDVRHMPAEVQQAAIHRMCDQLGLTRDEVTALIAEQKDREFGQAVLHALTKG